MSKQTLSNGAVASASDRAELAVGAGGRIEIAGREFPAPAAAVIALLDAIGSPFVSDNRDAPANSVDVFRTLYIIAKREDVAYQVLRISRARAALNKLGVPADGPGMMVLADRADQVAKLEAELDAAAVGFGESLGAFDMIRAAEDIGSYLSMATGFSMLPDPQDGQKKR